MVEGEVRQNLVMNYVVHSRKEKVMCKYAKKTIDRRATARRFENVVEFELDFKG